MSRRTAGSDRTRARIGASRYRLVLTYRVAIERESQHWPLGSRHGVSVGVGWGPDDVSTGHGEEEGRSCEPTSITITYVPRDRGDGALDGRHIDEPGDGHLERLE